MIRLYINGTEVKDFDWQNFSINIRRDSENKTMRITMPQTNTFRGDAYSIIRSAFNKYGWCATLPVVIQKSCGNGYEDIINGLIFINDCKFRTQRCEVDVPIRDNSYFAKIYSNEEIDICPDSNISKNGAEITSVTAKNIDLFNPSTGTYNSGFAHSGLRKGYDVFDVIKHQIEFCSDNALSAVSDWYSGLASDKKLALIYGYELRTGTATDYKFFVNHRETFKDVARLFNLFKNIDGNNLRIEEEDYLFNSAELFNLPKVKDVVQSAQLQNYYSSVEIGSATSTNIAQTFPILRYLSFQNENYGIKGTCNIDNQLNLKCDKFITDTNIIEDVLINDNEDYDTDLFLIQYDSATNKATKNNLSGIGGYFYNYELINGNVMNRYTFAGNAFSIINSLTDKFKATTTDNIYDWIGVVDLPLGTMIVSDHAPTSYPFAATGWTWIPSFRDESTSPNYDTDGRWDNVSNYYTASVSGEYSFRVVLKVYYTDTLVSSTAPPTNNRITASIIMNASVSGDFYVLETGQGWAVTSSGSHTYTFEFNKYLEAGEQLYIGAFHPILTDSNVGFVGCSFFWKPNCEIQCTGNPTSNGDYTFGNATQFKTSLMKFDQKLTASQVKLLLANPGHSFTFTEINDVEKKVWVNDITIQIKDNFASIEAISDLQNTQ